VYRKGGGPRNKKVTPRITEDQRRVTESPRTDSNGSTEGWEAGEGRIIVKGWRSKPGRGGRGSEGRKKELFSLARDSEERRSTTFEWL